MKKKERQTGKNYVFEQVTAEKRKIYSSNNVHSDADYSETRTKSDLEESLR